MESYKNNINSFIPKSSNLPCAPFLVLEVLTEEKTLDSVLFAKGTAFKIILSLQVFVLSNRLSDYLLYTKALSPLKDVVLVWTYSLSQSFEYSLPILIHATCHKEAKKPVHNILEFHTYNKILLHILIFFLYTLIRLLVFIVAFSVWEKIFIFFYKFF